MLLPGEHFEPLGGGISVIVSQNHRFGTDTVLLADFASPRKTERAAELGAGCGAIFLLWCREQAPAHCTAVELQTDACDMARRSVEYNHLQDRVSVLHADLRRLKGALPAAAFDLVVCNPPYKKLGTGLLNPQDAHKIARHEAECTIQDISSAAAHLLRFSGRLCLCQRPERLCDSIQAMRGAGIEPKRLRFVQQRTDKAPKLFLIEGKKGGKPGLTVQPTLLVEDESGGYSPEMKQIYKAYGENKV